MDKETKLSIPGDLGLKELENSINTKENVEGCRLIDLSKSEVAAEKKNVGIFVKAQRGVDVPELFLMKVEEGKPVEDPQPDNGKELVFQSVVFVNSEEQDIAGFR